MLRSQAPCQGGARAGVNYRAPGSGLRVRAGVPGRGDEAPLAIPRPGDARLVQRLAVPELAGDLVVLLVERLAVVRVFTHPHLGPAPEVDLPEPVRVGEALARKADDVGLSLREQRLGLVEPVDAAGDDHRRREARRPHRRPDRRGRIDVAAERAALVRYVLGHALVAARAGVGIRGPADRWLLRVVELAAARERQEVHPGARELHA